jgi:hypothetical protein
MTVTMPQRWAVVPRKIRRRRQQFVKVPWTWIERLKGAGGQTYRVALCLLHLHWKNRGEPIKLASGMLLFDGISRYSKWKALGDLERRGLVTVERRPRRSPIIRLVMEHLFAICGMMLFAICGMILPICLRFAAYGI